MKHVFASLIVIAVAASPAAADRVGLDYRATDASCVDASRFADEVSAKLGFVPWDAAASTKIRVRIAREGKQFTGSFLNVDGSSKIIDGASCSSVTASLAVSVAGALDESKGVAGGVQGGIVAPAPAPPPAAKDGKIAVDFVSADGRRIDISLNTGGGVGSASNGTTVVTNFYEGLCTSPCTARLPRGRHYLMFQDPDSAAAGGDRFLIERPTTITLHHKSRKGVRRGLFATGAVVTGASIIGGFVMGGTGGILLGSLGSSAGLTTMLFPLFLPDTFTATRSP